MNRIDCVCWFLLFVALSACSMPEEPITPNPDTTPDEVAEARAKSAHPGIPGTS